MGSGSVFHGIGTGVSVSILVLVDVGWEETGAPTGVTAATCFNPCFGGCRLGSLFFILSFSSSVSVSILVLVDVGWEVPLDPMKLLIVLCFNPCFGGCRLGRIIKMIKTCFYLGFQSLFWWMSVGKPM